MDAFGSDEWEAFGEVGADLAAEDTARSKGSAQCSTIWTFNSQLSQHVSVPGATVTYNPWPTRPDSTALAVRLASRLRCACGDPCLGRIRRCLLEATHWSECR